MPRYTDAIARYMDSRAGHDLMTHNRFFSTDHRALLNELATIDNLLIIQDLDGVCMGLVRDPLTRRLERRYLEAAGRLNDHFHVLTNGEHIGARGVNAIVERSLGSADEARRYGLYLPGLAAGGVQWQDRYGGVEHPGVSEAELDFLREVPRLGAEFLRGCLAAAPFELPFDERERLIASAVLDNPASPTLNLNGCYQRLADRPADWRTLQRRVAAFMDGVIKDAEARGLEGAFFMHYAPNAGRDAAGHERLRDGDEHQAGTTDFQLMLSGAVKEAGVLALLNRHIHARSGRYPLGEAFNARQAPRDLAGLVALVRQHIDPADMPTLIGVGDTVTSLQEEGEWHRGGSDRGFLTLVQQLGRAFERDNRVLFVDSSAGEVRRPGVDAALLARFADGADIDPWPGVAGITDPDDELTLDVMFPDGYTQYVDFFCALAARASGKEPQ
ncbi:glucosylglycerol 3-phosphatase [Kushneria aurantia]|uniref:Glucosylglycerol 3-phosphatase n=1 Tax=Kushneria aurantia TaxID=504092 RepID=A0ABV6G1A1_9GAMM|nr:glucosylglycerol 3-phosphatase [Kushneria aurantia]